jgi:hypothetical protein
MGSMQPRRLLAARPVFIRIANGNFNFGPIADFRAAPKLSLKMQV